MYQISSDYVSDIIQPRLIWWSCYAQFITHHGLTCTLFPLALRLGLFWLGTVLLLQSYRKRLGTIKFWIIMFVPLLYFLSQFQPLVTSMLFDYSSGNPMLYSIVYVLMLEVSTPVGGILFGLAFMLVARKIQNAKVKGYLSNFWNWFTLIINLVPASGNNNWPLSSIWDSFQLHSLDCLHTWYFSGYIHLLFQYLKIPNFVASIRKSVEIEVNFIGNIASAEMTTYSN